MDSATLTLEKAYKKAQHPMFPAEHTNHFQLENLRCKQQFENFLLGTSLGNS